jgi:Cu(I)/Ag(I) efflux system periplasmic protein CusF
MNVKTRRTIGNPRKEKEMSRSSTILIAVSIFGATLAFQAAANDGHMHHASNEAKPNVAARAAWTEGEVRAIDKTAGKLTIKHGAMPKFDMPPMTMAYRVKDKAMLAGLKPGDKIKFEADGVGGEFTVLRLEKLK